MIVLDRVVMPIVGPGSPAPMPNTPRDRYVLRPVFAGG
jgi:hypothetical protein